MSYRTFTYCLAVLTLGWISNTPIVAQTQSQSIEKLIEMDVIEEIENWLPIEINVKTGARTSMTVSGTPLLHDALLISTKSGAVSIDLDLVLLCPDSKQKFVKDKGYPARQHRNSLYYQRRGERWKLEFGRDCVVDSRDLGSPTIELITPSLAKVNVAKYGKLRVDEMIDDQVRIEIGGLARAEIARVEGQDVQISVTGSSDLNVDSLESVSTSISLSGLSGSEVGSIASSLVKIKQSGSSELATTSIETNRLVLSINGLSGCEVGRIFSSEGLSPNTDAPTSLLDLSGSSDASISYVELPKLDIDVSGLSDLELGQVQSNQLNLSAGGTSGVSVKRLSTDETQIETTGLADVEISAIEGNKAEIYASGISDVEVRTAKIDQLDVRSSGIGDVSVKGRE